MILKLMEYCTYKVNELVLPTQLGGWQMRCHRCCQDCQESILDLCTEKVNYRYFRYCYIMSCFTS